MIITDGIFYYNYPNWKFSGNVNLITQIIDNNEDKMNTIIHFQYYSIIKHYIIPFEINAQIIFVIFKFLSNN